MSNAKKLTYSLPSHRDEITPQLMNVTRIIDMKEPLFLRHLRNSAASGDSGSWADRFTAVRAPQKAVSDDDAPVYVLEDGKPISNEEFVRMGGEGGLTAEGEKQDGTAAGKDGTAAGKDGTPAGGEGGDGAGAVAGAGGPAARSGKDSKRAEGIKKPGPVDRDSPPPLKQALAELGYRKKRKAAKVFGLLDYEDEVDSKEEEQRRCGSRRRGGRLEKESNKPKLPWTGKRVRPSFTDDE